MQGSQVQGRTGTGAHRCRCGEGGACKCVCGGGSNEPTEAGSGEVLIIPGSIPKRVEATGNTWRPSFCLYDLVFAFLTTPWSSFSTSIYHCRIVNILFV